MSLEKFDLYEKILIVACVAMVIFCIVKFTALYLQAADSDVPLKLQIGGNK